ncbi:MAG: hypothetical protein AAF843_19175, partial [Bacteroidota bacterium]
SVAALDSWTPFNTDTNIPRVSPGETYNLQQSTRFIEDGDYLRIKNITIGATLPENILSKLKWFRSVRFYIQMQNLLTLTGYSGFDPEIGDRTRETRLDNIAVGIDEGTYPTPRTFLTGIQLQF